MYINLHLIYMDVKFLCEAVKYSKMWLKNSTAWGKISLQIKMMHISYFTHKTLPKESKKE